ncbi:TldD/PmbA family protein [uncultured Methanobrevibacter sp.]|uniref:TldD/PmbA family protein n=1 Tax=uncultured Methanobrevibacter sp. TaxID=253161 RepID=UPI0026034BDB
MEEYIDLFQKIITKIEDKVDYADIRAGNGNSTSLLMKDNQIQEVNTGYSTVARIRVLNNGAWGFASTNDFSKLEEITEKAIKISNSLKGDIKLAECDIMEDKVKTERKIPVSDISIDEKKELINEVNKATNVGKVMSTTVSYSDAESKSVFINSEGSNILTDSSRVILSLNAVASNGEIIQFSHGSLGGVKGFEVVQDEDIESFGRKIGEKATKLLDASPAPSGRFPIVADNNLTGVFIHEAVGHAVEADLVLQDDSILHDQMNKKIGTDIVNIYDDSSYKDGFGYYPYDVEGVKTRKNQIVKDGELISYLSSRESAGKLGIPLTGNARSSISDQPIVRMSNTYLEPGDLSFEELIEDINDGIYLKGSRGGQVDTGKGIFQFNAAEAYKIENGELKDHYRDVSLSGNILETLKGVDGIGSDFKLSVGFCGKGGQTAPVGDGGPHTRILNAMVGGSS